MARISPSESSHFFSPASNAVSDGIELRAGHALRNPRVTHRKRRGAAEIRRQRQRPRPRQFLQARRDLEGFFFEREVIVPRLDIAQQRLIRTARADDLDFDVRRRRAQQTRCRNSPMKWRRFMAAAPQSTRRHRPQDPPEPDFGWKRAADRVVSCSACCTLFAGWRVRATAA